MVVHGDNKAGENHGEQYAKQARTGVGENLPQRQAGRARLGV